MSGARVLLLALALCGCRDWDTAYNQAINDAGPIDAGPIDAGPIDAGPIDAGPIDAGPIDAGICGGKWCVYSSYRAPTFPTTTGIWASSPSNAWVTSYGSRLLHWDGAAWGTANISGFDIIGAAVWGHAPNKVWVTGDNGNYLGPPFSTKVFGADFDRIKGVHGLSDGGSIYGVAGNGKVFQYDGAAWAYLDAGVLPALRGVAVVAADDVWIAGEGGKVVHYDGVTWTEMATGVSDDFHRAWANGPNDVWFVGDVGRVLRWNGAGFDDNSCLGCGDLWGVWGQGANDTWIADNAGGLFHWDGGSYSPSIGIGPSSFNDPSGLWGAGDNDLFFSTSFDGGYGVLHFRR